MVEDNILSKDKSNKKKILIGSIAIVLLLLVAVVGATYAYFTLGVQNNFEDTDITIHTGKRNSITLSGGVSNYKIHLDVSDMAQNKVNNVYYGTTSESKNYETDKDLGTIILGNIETEDTLVDDYNCSATINIGLEGNMKDELKTNDLVLVIIQGNKESEYDLSESITSPTFSFALNKIEPIKAYLKFTNQNSDQSGLAGKTLNVTINVKDFVCEVDKGKPPLEMLKETGGEVFAGGGDHTIAVAGLYRYVGTKDQVTNNYICFGTTNIDTCTATGENNRDKHLYRIIGITDGSESDEESSLGLETGQLKIIKAIPSNTSQSWVDDIKTNIDWDNASNTIRKYLNETFLDTIDTTWKKLIDNPYWWKGDITSVGLSETNTKTTGKYPIGLMYQSDYYNSGTRNTTEWLHITNGRSDVANAYIGTNEWTMSRYGKNGDNSYVAWFVKQDSSLPTDYVASSYAVRPVFYLIPDITLTGEGTENNPFVISEG